MVLPPDHVTDVHEMVVDHAGKIVGHHAVRTEDDEIPDSLRSKTHLPVDEVFEEDRSPLHTKSQDRPLPGRFQR